MKLFEIMGREITQQLADSLSEIEIFFDRGEFDSTNIEINKHDALEAIEDAKANSSPEAVRKYDQQIKRLTHKIQNATQDDYPGDHRYTDASGGPMGSHSDGWEDKDEILAHRRRAAERNARDLAGRQ